MRSFEMDSDEAFDSFIEFNENLSDSDTDKENISKSVKSKRVKNTKKEQFELISSFVKDHNEDSLGKTIFTEQWESLTTDLNNIGPPTHSTTEWRKIWSEYKYNHTTKRKLRRKSANASEKRRKVELNQTVDVTNEFIPHQFNQAVGVPNQLVNQKDDVFNQTLGVQNQISLSVDTLHREGDVVSQSLGVHNRTDAVNIVNNNQFQSDLLAKLDVIIKQQEKTNSLLQKLVNQSVD